jgi:hypothetical protein
VKAAAGPYRSAQTGDLNSIEAAGSPFTFLSHSATMSCMNSTAATVTEYLESLPGERALVVRQVRDVLRASLPEGFVETMDWGMICYEVPLEVSGDTYNRKPLLYAALAAQKRYYSLYLMSLYQDPTQLERLRAAYAESGKQLKMGASCIRFTRISDLELDSIREIISGTSLQEFIASYRRAHPSK